MTIATQRLIIRPYEEGDLKDFHEIFSNEAVMRFCEPPYSHADSQKWLGYFIQNPIAFAVVLKSGGKAIGHALFKQLPGEEQGIWEIGWIFNQAFWRRGYAFEAASTLMAYGFETLKLHKICAETTDPEKSVPLMKKLGMQEEGVFRQHTKGNDGSWADLYWYAALAPEYP
ncbi:MAG: GNAT family N-acetyltransferase [Eubacteriales bacterium]|nr:GNAT family N-acetyltransferase [Eubacteriales bacterium]